MKVFQKMTALTTALLLAIGATGCANTPASSAPAAPSAPASEVASAAKEPASAGAASTPAAASQRVTVRVATLKGPSGLSMVHAMDEDENDDDFAFRFTVDTQPTAVVSKLTSGEADLAALPTNLPATLYQKTKGKVQLLAVNTLGVLHIVTNGAQVQSIADLKGKTVLSSGKGGIPEYAFNYILEQNGLKPGKDVKVEYASEHAEVSTKLIAGDAKIAVLPEPFVTQTLAKCKTAKLSLDLTKEWDKAAKGQSALAMGVVAVRKEFAQAHPDLMDDILDELADSAEDTTKDLNESAALAEKYLGIPKAVAAKAIPNCSITHLQGAQMKAKVQPLLKVLFDANPKSVGGKLPDDDFYYIPKD